MLTISVCGGATQFPDPGQFAIHVQSLASWYLWNIGACLRLMIVIGPGILLILLL